MSGAALQTTTAFTVDSDAFNLTLFGQQTDMVNLFAIPLLGFSGNDPTTRPATCTFNRLIQTDIASRKSVAREEEQ
jgi:hypothetical protein